MSSKAESAHPIPDPGTCPAGAVATALSRCADSALLEAYGVCAAGIVERDLGDACQLHPVRHGMQVVWLRFCWAVQ
jgi:hypothetical protein